MWSMLPGARSLTATRITDVSRALRSGYVNVHTLQGQLCTQAPAELHRHKHLHTIQGLLPQCCSQNPRSWNAIMCLTLCRPSIAMHCLARPLTLSMASAAGNAIVDGIAASNYVLQEDYGLRLDAVASERFKKLVRVSRCFAPPSGGNHPLSHLRGSRHQAILPLTPALLAACSPQSSVCLWSANRFEPAGLAGKRGSLSQGLHRRTLPSGVSCGAWRRVCWSAGATPAAWMPSMPR